MKPLWLRVRRRQLARRNAAGPFAELVRSPLPRTSLDLDAIEFVSLDLETTGLDAASAEILSAGWVLVRGSRVLLETATARVVRPSGEVGASATVHGLTDAAVSAGSDWGDVLDEIVATLAERVLLVHNAALDKALLDRLSRQRFGAALPVPVVDTLVLERRRRHRRPHAGGAGSLRLADVRDTYGLPRYAPHDSLVDAIATAELFVAMAAHSGARSLADLHV